MSTEWRARKALNRISSAARADERPPSRGALSSHVPRERLGRARPRAAAPPLKVGSENIGQNQADPLLNLK